MDIVKKGFLLKKNGNIRVDHKKTSSILLNNLHIDLLLYFKSFFRGKMLDAGCGEKPYGLIYDKLVEEAIGWDVEVCIHNQQNIDIYASLDNLPFKDETFDTILCTNVLEHVADSQIAFKELARVLKKDGSIIISVPFLYPVHEAPYDFYRYTKFGLTHQIEKNGLQVKKCIALGGVGMFLFVYLNLFFINFLKIGFLKYILNIIQEIFYKIYKKMYFSSILKSKNKVSNIITLGYFVIATK